MGPPEDLILKISSEFAVKNFVETGTYEGATAVLASVTSLPEQAADAAFLFDPFSVGKIADALKQLTTNADLRRNLRVKGARRLRDFRPERTARAYLAIYKKAAGILSSDDEKDLLFGNKSAPLEKG
jgi:glycosyltransferase involved in cell wall biosynthesis